MTLDGIGGRLVLRPGQQPALQCQRPMIGASLLRRLTEGRRAVMLPDLIGTVFTLCAQTQRSTARRAVRAALGLHDNAAQARHDARMTALRVVREQLQRLALDLPALTQAPVPSAHWIRHAPVMGLGSSSVLPEGADSVAAQTLAQHTAAALPAWLEQNLFAMPLQTWLDGWQANPAQWLARWAQAQGQHPVGQWLVAVQGLAQSQQFACQPLAFARSPADDMPVLAAALAVDPGFAQHPTWHGEAVETGPWTRWSVLAASKGAPRGQPSAPTTLWERLGARLADVARIALATSDAGTAEAACAAGATAAAEALPALSRWPLSQGALTLAPGEGIAWTEMSRGLLVHWVRLEPARGAGGQDPATARAERYHVLAPTEWNFHPEGAFAHWLAAQDLQDPQTLPAVRLAAATLDPCLAFSIEEVANHA